MFAFKLWGHFGAFRDPITITQNITLSIPPKTTIGGMLAAILGIDYNEYFNDSEYFDFEYSVVLNNHIRKKSFSQNYVEDYTKKSEIKQNNFIELQKKKELLNSLKTEQEELLNKKNISNKDEYLLDLDFGDNNSSLSKKEEKKLAGMNGKISKASNELEKHLNKVQENILVKMTKPKPIRRELLINPNYTIFINDFKYERDIISAMKKHQSAFMFYMGNSEFPANYEYLECLKSESCLLDNVDSFTKSFDKINFEVGNKYSTIYFATKVIANRKYRDYKKSILGNFGKKISFKESIEGYSIKLANGNYNCEFI